DTDYTITIADDIEYGTLTGAATAKYMEKVTITATPDLGYRLSGLVVNDADNNDVATTGNSFFMPKGNVTVSAVFEQGTHGTTEFAWGYYGPSGFVREASIYDGVTTVELQQGQSYRILKYDEDSYRKFLLDNDIYNVTIPYSGGTGTFTYANGTNFRVDYNDESGYYDITMTDAGNGKWSVSILKTVGVIGNIPDQTYTGSEIKPEPQVMAGSLSLTKGTDYTYSYTDNTNVGTAKVTVTFKGDYASLGSVEKEFIIVKATPTVTAPTANTLTCNGDEQELVTAGSTNVGKVLYSLDGTNYSEDIPKGTDAGIYTVYYKVDTDNYFYAPQTVTAKIGDGIGERLMGYSLSLDGDIGVNFYMELDQSVIEDTGAYMQFTLPNGDMPKVYVKDVKNSPVDIEDKTYYVFKCNVAAKEMTDTIKAQMFSGGKSGQGYEYTVKEYADYLLDNTNKNEEYEKVAPLVKAMLNYGTYAQEYFGYKTDKPANASLSAADKALGEVIIPGSFKYNADNTSITADGVTFAGATLSLKSETTLSLYFTGLPDNTVFSCEGKKVETAKNGGYVVARIRGIKAEELKNDFTVTFGNGGSVTYNAMTYCYNVLNGGSDNVKLQNVVKALYKYAEAAKPNS
ncbi:MAG: hypothetical protein IJ141_05810, partial [Lachnospiraceae bacterium]|nr:hypothetical protein [Lachnospiraceae bacterium]